MGGDGSFAEDHPGTAAAGEIDDGRGNGASGGSAVDDEIEAVAELVEDAFGGGALGLAVEVGGGGGDGVAEGGDDSPGNGGFGDAEGYVAGLGGDAEGDVSSGFDDEGEGAGPELFGETVEGAVEVATEFVGLGDFGDEQRERFVLGAGFEIVDALDGTEIDGVDGEAVEGVGGQGDELAGAE